jgi:hypothetical protein
MSAHIASCGFFYSSVSRPNEDSDADPVAKRTSGFLITASTPGRPLADSEGRPATRTNSAMSPASNGASSNGDVTIEQWFSVVTEQYHALLSSIEPYPVEAIPSGDSHALVKTGGGVYCMSANIASCGFFYSSVSRPIEDSDRQSCCKKN